MFLHSLAASSEVRRVGRILGGILGKLGGLKELNRIEETAQRLVNLQVEVKIFLKDA